MSKRKSSDTDRSGTKRRKLTEIDSFFDSVSEMCKYMFEHDNFNHRLQSTFEFNNKPLTVDLMFKPRSVNQTLCIIRVNSALVFQHVYFTGRNQNQYVNFNEDLSDLRTYFHYQLM